MSNQPTPQDLAAYAIKTGMSQADAARLFGLDGTQSTLGARAQAQLDQNARDPEFAQRLFAGDPAARAEFDRLTLGVSYQNDVNRAEELRAATEQFEQQQRAEADAAKAAEAAKSAEK